MRDRPRHPPRLSEAGTREQAARQARLGEALRDNLRKRKAQARGRDDSDTAAEPGAERPAGAGGKP